MTQNLWTALSWSIVAKLNVHRATELHATLQEDPGPCYKLVPGVYDWGSTEKSHLSRWLPSAYMVGDPLPLETSTGAGEHVELKPLSSPSRTVYKAPVYLTLGQPPMQSACRGIHSGQLLAVVYSIGWISK